MDILIYFVTSHYGMHVVGQYGMPSHVENIVVFASVYLHLSMLRPTHSHLPNRAIVGQGGDLTN